MSQNITLMNFQWEKGLLSLINFFSNKIKNILTYNDLYHNTMFQYFLANSYNKHFIMSAQHGCAYGMDKRHEGEVFEKSISQKFFKIGFGHNLFIRPTEINVYKKTSSREFIRQRSYTFWKRFYLKLKSGNEGESKIYLILAFFQALKIEWFNLKKLNKIILYYYFLQ